MKDVYTYVTTATKVKIDIPKGYRIVEVGRLPRKGEYYIHYMSFTKPWAGPYQSEGDYHDLDASWYVIVEKATKLVDQVTLTSTGQIRCPKVGEWLRDVCGPGGGPVFWQAQLNYEILTYEIFTMTTTKIEVPDED